MTQMVRLPNFFFGFPAYTFRSCVSTFALDGREATTADDMFLPPSVTDDFTDSCVDAPVMKSTLPVVLVLNDRLTDLAINL
jgi:hypothetical protein